MAIPDCTNCIDGYYLNNNNNACESKFNIKFIKIFKFFY